MGTKNISITDEAYQRLSALKAPRESFTDVINRITGRRSILELAGILSEEEADELRTRVKDLRQSSRSRATIIARRVKGH